MENLITSEDLQALGVDFEALADGETLEHHGIKGMRWGRRRYQNPDGSLTEAGRKRYNQEVEALKAQKAKLEEKQKNMRAQQRMQARTDKLRADIDELKGKKKPDSEDDGKKLGDKLKEFNEGRKQRQEEKHSKKPKKPSEMTAEELNEEIQKMRAIQTYNQLYSQLHPAKVNKGKEVAQKFLNESLLPAATNAAKKVGEEWLTKAGKELLGLNEKEAKSALQKAEEAWKISDFTLKTKQNEQNLEDLNDTDKRDSKRAAEISKNLADVATNKANTADANNRYAKATDKDYQDSLRKAEKADAEAKKAQSSANAAESKNKETRADIESDYYNNPDNRAKAERNFRREQEAIYEGNRQKKAEANLKAAEAKEKKKHVGEESLEETNKRLKAEYEYAKLTDPNYQQKSIEADLAGMDTKIGVGKKNNDNLNAGKDYEKIAKDILRNTKSIDPSDISQSVIDDVEKMLENGAFNFNWH